MGSPISPERSTWGSRAAFFIIDNDKNLIYNSASQEQVELLSGVALASSGSWIEK